MECDILKKSMCLCGSENEFSPTLSISLINMSRHSSSSRTPQIICSCCNCNPFQDDSKEIEICDLGFALRKLAAMNRQMKKWQGERLRLENETRTLKKALKSCASIRNLLKDFVKSLAEDNATMEAATLLKSLVDSTHNLSVIKKCGCMNPSPIESTSFVDSKPENEKLKSQIIRLMRNIGYCQSEISYLSCKIDGLNDVLENIEQLGLHRRELVNQKLSEETAAANISNLEKEIQVLKNELQEHQRTNKKSSDNLSDSDKQHSAVREENHIKQLELHRGEVVNKELSEKIAAASISNLEREIQVLKNESQEHQRTNEGSNDKLSDSNEQHQALKEENHIEQLELRRGEVVNKELSEEIAATSISNLEREIQVLKNESQEHRQTNEKSDDNLSDSNEQHPALKEENHIEQLELRRGEVVNKELSEEIAAASISDLEREIQVLKNESQEHQQTNEKSDDNLSGSDEQNPAVREENHILQDDKLALKNFIQQLQNSYDEMMGQFLDTKNKVESILSQVKKLDGDIIALKSENENLKKENSAITKQLNANSDNLDDVYNKLDLSRIKLSDKEAQLKSLESNVNDYKSREEILSTELDNLRSEIENIKKHYNTEFKAMEEKAKELSAVKDEFDQRDQNWNQLKIESDSLKKDIKDLENDNKVLNNHLERVDSVINKLQVENDSLKLKIKTFDTEFKSAEIDDGVQQKTQDESMKRSMNLETSGKSERESTDFKTGYSQTDVDVSPNTALQENLNIIKDNAVKLKEKFETRNIENDQFYKELNKIKNHLENLELKSNQTLKLNEELMNKIKTMNTETASLDKKIAGLQTDKNINIGSRNKDSSSKHDSFQKNFNTLRDSVVNLKEKIETRNIENDQFYRELNKLRNHLENLELKSNQTLKLNEELMDKVKTINNETAGLDRKIVGLLTDKSINIGSHNKDTLSKDDGFQGKSGLEKPELKKKDTDDFIEIKNKDGDFNRTNKTSREVKSKVLSDTVDVGLTDQFTKDFEAQQKEMESLRLEKMTLQDNLKKAENDLKKYKNENRNLKDEVGKKVDEPLARIETTYEDRNNLLHDNEKSQKAMLRKTKLNGQVVNTTSKSFKEKSNGKSLLENENIINELLDFICRRMIKQIEGLSCIHGIIDDMKNDFSERTVTITSLISDNSMILNFSNPLATKISELSDDLSNDITDIIRDLTAFSEIWRDCRRENKKLKEIVENETSKTQNYSEDDILKFDRQLEFLTLTQLADIHDKICYMTSKKVNDDECFVTCCQLNETLCCSQNLNPCQQNYEMAGKRVAALQRQILKKQLQTKNKVTFIRKTLRHEQAELIGISGIINQEKERNYALHFIMDPTLFTSNKCAAKCAKNNKFISIVEWKKNTDHN